MTQTNTTSQVESMLAPQEIGLRPQRAPARFKGAMCLDFLELSTILAQQPTRLAAIKAMASWFSDQFPNAVVRVAWGSKKPQGMIDHRLGKLGPESSLWQQLLANWQQHFTEASSSPEQDESRIWLCFPSNSINVEDSTRSFAVLWIESLPLGANIARQIAPAADAIGAVLWSRPRVHITPRWFSSHRQWLIAMFIAFVVAGIVACWPVPYRVDCQSVVQPVARRVVATPFDATLLECLVEPGDEVHVDQLLMVFDGRPLQLELEALRADLSQSKKQYSSALASGKIADAQLAELERLQLEHRIQVIEERLAKLEVTSPIDGVVLSGDMKRSIGAPLKTGDPLLEIAPLERVLIEVEIPEEEIHFVDLGDTVRVRLDSDAQTPIVGEVERVFPQAEVRRERNVFVARWEAANQDRELRPGMQGTAIILGPQQPLAWPWIRRGYEASLRALGW